MSRIARHILSNKLRVLMIPYDKKKASDLVTVAIFIRAGSRDETRATNGIAHYLEHMMFKGTKNMPGNKISEILDNVGAHYNAMTSKEYTGYYINGQLKDINLFIEVIVDLYCNPMFREKDINMERTVILEEMNMSHGKASNTIMTRMHKILFAGSPLADSILGTEETINRMRKKDFLEFRNRFYHPANSIMVICGNINQADIIRKVNREFKKAKKSWTHCGTNAIMTYKFMQNEPYVNLYHSNRLKQTQVMFAFRSYPHGDKRSPVLDLISEVLSSGSSSRLFDTLRNKLGITYFNHSYLMEYIDNGLFIIYVGVDNNKVYDVINAVVSELVKLKKKGVTEKELKKVKKIKKTSSMFELQSTTDYVMTYGLTEIYDVPDSFIPKKDFIEMKDEEDKKISVKIINEQMRETFQADRLNLFVYGNTKDLKKDLGKLESCIERLK